MNPLMTILIPTYRNPQFLEHTLHSLLLHTEFPYQIVVLNNDGTDKSKIDCEKIATGCQFPAIKVRNLGGNRGWMGAINAGMEDVDTPYVCLLNDDVIFIPGQTEFWRKLLRWFGDEQVAAVGPSSNFVMGGQSIFHTNGGLPPYFQAKFLIGFCMMLRTDRFREVGMLDENLPGGDDLDLSIRLRQAGYSLIADRSAYLHHIGSLTGNRVHQGYWNSDIQTDRSNNALIRKHGLKAWYELVSGDLLSEALKPAINELRDAENVWVAEQVPTEGRGLALGCGAKKIHGEYGLDIARSGDHGAGGRKFTGATPDITADATDIPVVDGSLDYLTALHIFEHLLDPIAALGEWRRVLKPGGKLVIVCPNHHGMATMLIDYTHLHAFTPESLQGLLEAAGWTIGDRQVFPIGTMGLSVYAPLSIPVTEEDPETKFQRIMGDG